MRVTAVAVTVVEAPQLAPLSPYRSHLRSRSTPLKRRAGPHRGKSLEGARAMLTPVGDSPRWRRDPTRSYSRHGPVVLAGGWEQSDLKSPEPPIPAEPLPDATWLRQQTRVPIA